MNHTILKLEDSHIEVDAYPKRALFEGIINAVAHKVSRAFFFRTNHDIVRIK